MDLEEGPDRVVSRYNIWARVIFYNVFIFLAIYIFVVKGWYNLLDGIHGLGDLAGLLVLLVFIYGNYILDNLNFLVKVITGFWC